MSPLEVISVYQKIKRGGTNINTILVGRDVYSRIKQMSTDCLYGSVEKLKDTEPEKYLGLNLIVIDDPKWIGKISFAEVVE